jgi:hypothetical protein
MPDDQQQQVQQPPAPPAFNADALAATINTAVRNSVSQLRQEAQQEQVQQQQRAGAIQSAQQWMSDPLTRTVLTAAEPALRAVTLKAESAMDKADFYTGRPEAVEYRADIEHIFNAMVAQNKPLDRESCWTFFRGTDKFRALEQQKRETSQAEAARRGTVIGPSGMARPGGELAFSPSTPLEDMRKQLSGVTF